MLNLILEIECESSSQQHCDNYWLNNSGKLDCWAVPKAAVGNSEEKGSFIAPIVINRTLLITHWGIKYSTDNRPRLSWRATSMQRYWTWSWPWNSCSGLKHLIPQRAKQTDHPAFHQLWISSGFAFYLVVHDLMAPPICKLLKIHKRHLFAVSLHLVL